MTDRVAGDIPWWIRQTGNMFVLRFRSNEVASDLRFAETIAALDSLALGAIYPREPLETAWRDLLEVQQHEQFYSSVCNGQDVLDWSNAGLDRAQAIARSCADLAMRDIASRIRYAPHGRPLAVFNHLNWECREVVRVLLPAGETNTNVLDSAGRPVPAAVRQSGEGRELAFVATAPPLGYACYYLAPGSGDPPRPRAANTIENEFYRLTVDSGTGLIASLLDKRLRRKLVDPARPAGGFKLVWDDGGPGTDFWSISRPSGKVWSQRDYRNSQVTAETSPLAEELIVRGPLLDQGEANFGPWREVRYRLAAGLACLEIGIHYAWNADKARRAWLMFDLPLALRDARATCGSPFCAVDYQEFAGDQPALRLIRTMHDWCDLYDAGADTGVTLAGPSTQVELRGDGVAIALVSRHGSTPGNLCIGLHGEHSFRYALRSHRGDWRGGDTVRFGCQHAATALRAVLASPRAAELPPEKSLLPLAGDRVAVSALKQTHTGEDLLLRVYETSGNGGAVRLPDAAGYGIVGAWRSNILEEALAPLEPAALGNLPLRPWEILSLRLKPAPRGGEVADWKGEP